MIDKVKELSDSEKETIKNTLADIKINIRSLQTFMSGSSNEGVLNLVDETLQKATYLQKEVLSILE